MTFSIIIPTYNRDEDLESCLKSLKDNSAYNNEVIVLYNLNENTKAICDKYGAKSVFDNARKNGKRIKGLWAILNEGIKAAKNDCVMYLNDDCLVLPDWDKIAAVYFENDKNLGLLVLKTKGIGQDPNFRVIKSLFDFPCANYAILNKKANVLFDEHYEWFYGDADLPLQIGAFSNMNVGETSENMVVHNHRLDENRKINEDKSKEAKAVHYFSKKWFFYERADGRLRKKITIKKIYSFVRAELDFLLQGLGFGKKIDLPNVTLLSVSSVRIHETVKALKYSCKGIKFGKVLLLSDVKPRFLPKKIQFVKIPKIANINDFNKFMVFDLYKYVDTDYILQVHYDGFVVHPELWRDEFLNYDYIGSPWPEAECFKDKFGVAQRVGNSVGIRSKKLLALPVKLKIPFEPDSNGFYNEDAFICCRARHIFEENGCIFAPLDVAKHFGKEIEIPENKGLKTFLFHKWRGDNAVYPCFERLGASRLVKRFIKKIMGMDNNGNR